MSELLREIEEDIRREKLEKLWHGFGKAMVAASIAIVLATVAIVVMQNRKAEQANERTSQFIKGLDRLNIEDYKGAITAFEALTEDPNSSYYGLAMLRKAQAESSAGDAEAAARTYHTLARQDSPEGQLAAMLGEDGNPGKQPAEGSAFYYTQSEWNAWQLLQAGKKEEGIAQLKHLAADTGAPYSMRERLNEALHHLAPETAKPETQPEENAAHE